MKYSKIFIGIVNNSNIKNIETLQQVANTCIVLFSNIDLLSLSEKELDILKCREIVFIPNPENIKSANELKKISKYTLFIDWLLKQPSSLKFILNNGSLLYTLYKGKDWFKFYDGSCGWAISFNKEEIEENFEFGTIINDKNRLILKEFDGRFLKDYQ